MANSIEQRKNYTNILDEVYQNAACSTCLNSGRGMVRAGAHAHEILIPKISVTGLGNYTRNVGYTDVNITFAYETKAFNYDRGTRLLADVMDVEEAGVMDCFVAAGSELQRTQVAPEGDAFCFSQIASHTGVTTVEEEFNNYADADTVMTSLRRATSEMDEKQVTATSRILFITPTLKGLLDDFSLVNPNRSNAILSRFSRIVSVLQSRFYTAITLNPGTGGSFGYGKGANGKDINYMIVEKSAVIKFDKHVVSKVFKPSELETLDSYMLKYRKYGLVELFDNKLDGIHVSCASS